MSYKVFVILLCLGITIVLAGITLICSMNQEKIGFKILLIGGVMAGAGLVGIVYLLFGIVPAIIAGLACVLYMLSHGDRRLLVHKMKKKDAQAEDLDVNFDYDGSIKQKECIQLDDFDDFDDYE